MKLPFSLVGLIISILFVSCLFPKKETDMQKLAHKWVARKAYVNVPNMSDMTDSIKYIVVTKIKEAEASYIGQTYNLRADSTFTANGKVTNVSGKWCYRPGEIIFAGKDNSSCLWSFPSKNIRIGMDSAIDVKITLDLQVTFVELYMKPAPGEKLNIDYFGVN